MNAAIDALPIVALSGAETLDVAGAIGAKIATSVESVGQGVSETTTALILSEEIARDFHADWYLTDDYAARIVIVAAAGSRTVWEIADALHADLVFTGCDTAAITSGVRGLLAAR